MKTTIYNGNSLERIKELQENSVHLVVTSPPYFNAKKYNEEKENVGNNEDYLDYLGKIQSLLSDINRVLVPGGVVCWNTSPVLDDGKRLHIPFDTHLLFLMLNYEFLEDIKWVKPDGAAKLRCGGWVQNKGKPLTWHANIVDEYIMVYKKPGAREEGQFDPLSKYYSERPKDLLTNVWYIQPETKKSYHDAPFPVELAKRCILLYSFKGDNVLDPFMGTGTVLKVARELERDSIGIELSPEYVAKAKEFIGWGQTSLTLPTFYEEK